MMPIRKLLDGQSFGPERIELMREAFDRTWGLISPCVDARPEAVEAARAKLAEAILSVAKDGAAGVDEVVRRTLNVMNAPGR